MNATDDEIFAALSNGSAPATDTEVASAMQRGNRRQFLLNTVKSLVGAADPLGSAGTEITDPEAETLLRIGANIYSAPLKFVPNVANLAERGVRYLLGNQEPPVIPSGRDLLNRGLSAAGINPESQGPAERYGTLAGEALMTAGTAGVAGLPWMAANPGTQAAAAVTGAAANDYIRANYPNAPSWVAPVVGMAAGMATGTVSPMVQRIGTGANTIRGYYTQGGTEEAAGRYLNRLATTPETVPERVAAQTAGDQHILLPGSTPTLPEVAQNPGLAAAYRQLPATQAGMETGAVAMRGNRLAQSDSAIRNAIDENFGTVQGTSSARAEQIINEQQAGLKKVLDSQYDLSKIKVDASGLRDNLAKIRSRYEGNQTMTDFLDGLIHQIDDNAIPIGLGKPELSANFLWNARQGLDDKIYEGLLTSSKEGKQMLGGIGEVVRRFYNQAITDVAPSFQDYLQKYSALQRVKERMVIGEETLQKSSLANRNALTPAQAEAGALYGEARLSLPKYESTLTRLQGDKVAWRGLLPEQQQVLTGPIADELRRRQFLETGGGLVGSDTAQKLAANNLLGMDLAYAMTGQKGGTDVASKVITSIGRSLNPITGSTVQDIMLAIQKGLIDPKYGAALMRQAGIPVPLTLSGFGASTARGGMAALLYGTPPER